MVPIRVDCPSCGRPGRWPAPTAGTRARCPSCGAVVTAVRSATSPRPPSAPIDTSRHAILAALLIGPLAGCGAALIVLVAVGMVPAWRDRLLPARAPASRPESPPAVVEAPEAPAPSVAPRVVAERPDAPAVVEPKPVAPTLTAEQVAARAEAAVALIRGKRAAGTGFLIRPGLLATNAHVLDDEFLRDVSIRFPSATDSEKDIHVVELRYEDRRRDLAFLTVRSGLGPLELAPDSPFRKGQEVFVIGQPGLGGDQMLENAISRGLLSTRVTLGGLAFDQLSLALNPGQSGSPVLDATGRVIGLASAKAMQGEGLAFSIPADDLHAALARAEAQGGDEPGRTESIHRLGVVLRLLVTAGRLFGEGLDPRPGHVKGASWSAAEGVRARIKDLDRTRFPALRDEVSRIGADTRLAPKVRKAVVDLWANLTAMKTQLDTPRAEDGNFRVRALELKAKYAHLVASLRQMPEVTSAALLPPATIPGRAPGLDDPSGPDPSAPPESTRPPLTVIDLSIRPEVRAGYVRIHGKIKNRSGRPLEGLWVRVRITSKRGIARAYTRARVVPDPLAPDATGAFFTRAKIVAPDDRYAVDYLNADGEVLPSGR